jgi:glycosyltransferase involved in cell wall biosynthesis
VVNPLCAVAAAPFFSVVVPVRDGARHLPLCLAALRRSSCDSWELWVVDDGSTDGSAAIAAAAGAAVLATGGSRGPGAARNLAAARARGEYLFFLDADCEVHADTLSAARARLLASPGLAALFGSYDDAPAAPGLVSQYKNLLHHYVHQQGREEAATFWAGCGAVRRAEFLAAGGFDERRFRRPAVEDIELGYRLRDRGGRIVLAKEVQVKHLKRWTLAALLRSDLRDRALPWARLLLERGGLHADLNIDRTGRLCAAAAAAGAAAACAAPLSGSWLWVTAAAGGVLLALNRRLYRFFLERRGALFTGGAILLHWLYHLYCAAAAAVAMAGHLGRQVGARAAAAAR